MTPDNKIARTVDWGDGTSADWATGTTLTHVYKSHGTFTPRVTLTDQAGNSSAPIASSPSRSRSTRRPRSSSSGCRGTSTPSRRGRPCAARPRTRAPASRRSRCRSSRSAAATWYGYNAKTHRWIKAATKAKAFAKQQDAPAKIDAQHRWSAKLAHLRKGTLVYKVWATDEVKNRSATVTHKASLTHR